MQLTPTLFEYAGKVRVESGPKKLTETATEGLLSDRQTASHYFEGNPDAVGKKIVLGEPMTYLDWKGPFVWYVYTLDTSGETPIWKPFATVDTFEQAGEVVDFILAH